MPIIDITLTITNDLVTWPDGPRVEMVQFSRIADGARSNNTKLSMGAHTGTHVDAPAHFVLGGSTVEAMDLNVLIGPALVVEVPDADEITPDVLDGLAIPAGTQRLLFRTRNSALWTRHEPDFRTDYVAVSGSAARWLVEHGVRLVGVDYLSVAPWNDLLTCHDVLLGAGVVVVEGLALDGVPAGEYQLICLPTKLGGSDGAPARAVLVTP